MSEFGPTQDDDVQLVNIEEEIKQSYLEYAMAVIVGRALPDVRDGLKPVHKRVLYAMNELNNVYNRPYVKSARVVGEVIGKYHLMVMLRLTKQLCEWLKISTCGICLLMVKVISVQ